MRNQNRYCPDLNLFESRSYFDLFYFFTTDRNGMCFFLSTAVAATAAVGAAIRSYHHYRNEIMRSTHRIAKLHARIVSLKCGNAILWQRKLESTR